MQQLYGIRDVVIREHKFSEASRQVVLKAANGLDPAPRHVAIGLLTLASRSQLYPVGELLTFLEKKAVSARRGEPELYLLEYAEALGVNRPPDQRYQDRWRVVKEKYLSGLGPEKSYTTLNSEEKAFASEILALPDTRNSLLAGRLFIRKFDMDPDSSQWIRDQVTSQIKKTQGDIKQYWELVLRVSSARNLRHTSK